MPERRSVENMVGDALKLVQQERPDTPAADVQPMNWLEARLRPDAEAVTLGPHIRYNTDILDGRSVNELADMLTHELQHVRQHPTTLGALVNLVTSPQMRYSQTPDEIEAFDAERARRASQGRPEPAGVYGETVGDIMLPSVRRRKVN